MKLCSNQSDNPSSIIQSSGWRASMSKINSWQTSDGKMSISRDDLGVSDFPPAPVS